MFLLPLLHLEKRRRINDPMDPALRSSGPGYDASRTSLFGRPPSGSNLAPPGSMSLRAPHRRPRTLCALLARGRMSAIAARAGEEDDRWWPEQKVPRAIVRATDQGAPPALRGGLQVMVQSVAGLAAKAVNEGGGREMVWVSTGNADLENWYGRFLAAHREVKEAGSFQSWELVGRYHGQGIIKGYILFRPDASRGDLNTYRPGIDRQSTRLNS